MDVLRIRIVGIVGPAPIQEGRRRQGVVIRRAFYSSTENARRHKWLCGRYAGKSALIPQEVKHRLRRSWYTSIAVPSPSHRPVDNGGSRPTVLEGPARRGHSRLSA